MKSSVFMRKKSKNYFCGYKVINILEISEKKSIFYLLKHNKTGAQHIHIENNDSNNCFGIAFKTVPFDSTGVSHILEHTVLCGSSKFPVRDPFFSMLKRSLSTFMNAFTSSDWTMYPFSTQNEKDYYNLLDVYLNSVFFPLIRELSFKQEGCRIDFGKDILKKELIYKGVVYNEMKGAMSSADQIMIRSLFNALYPQSTYSKNSGGNPSKIPSLTYEDLKKFHKRYYHPSNSFFYTYGNLPLKKHLEYIDKHYLSVFLQKEKAVFVSKQPRWEDTKIFYYSFPATEMKNDNKKCQICLAWLTVDIKNSLEVLVLIIIEQLLLGNEGSPLRKVLMDSKLGSSLSDGSGFDSENKDTIFVCGLKEVEESNSKKIKNIILRELEKIIKEGICDKDIESVLHQIEISRKEESNIPYPYGIKLLLNISSYWFHGGDPTRLLQLDKDLDQIKKNILLGRFFEKKIKEYFLDNKHMVLLILKPNKKMEENENKRIRDELFKIRSSMETIELNKIKLDSLKLDTLIRVKEENLSFLPTLQIKEINQKITLVNSPIVISKEYNVKGYEQPTNGVFYFYALINISLIKRENMALVPFFCYLMTKMGTCSKSYTKIAQDIDLYTGGMAFMPHPYMVYDKSESCLPVISISSKSLVRNVDKIFDIMLDILVGIDFNNYDRIIQLLYEYKVGLESGLVQNGHNLALSLASRKYSTLNYIKELWSGVSQFNFIKNLTENINEKTVKRMILHFYKILNVVSNKKNFKITCIGDKSSLLSASYNVDRTFAGEKTNDLDFYSSIDYDLKNLYFLEGWSISTSVSFVAHSFKTVKITNKDSPSLSVLSKVIKSMYLHKEIREKGGAYGGFSIYDLETGIFSFCSYRDPHIIRTLDIYDGVNNFILNYPLKSEEIKEAILQICADIDRPSSPSLRAKKDFIRKTMKFSDKIRQDYKTRLLNLNKKNIIEVSEKYFGNKAINKSRVIISNNKLLKKAKKRIISEPLIINNI